MGNSGSRSENRPDTDVRNDSHSLTHTIHSIKLEKDEKEQFI